MKMEYTGVSVFEQGWGLGIQTSYDEICLGSRYLNLDKSYKIWIFRRLGIQIGVGVSVFELVVI